MFSEIKWCILLKWIRSNGEIARLLSKSNRNEPQKLKRVRFSFVRLELSIQKKDLNIRFKKKSHPQKNVRHNHRHD